MTEIIFKRKIYSKILIWKETEQGKTSLLIEGARRVGKSTVVQEFAKNEYESYIFIDFNKVSDEIKNLFKDINDLDYVFLYLQTYFKVTLKERKSLIVFDEVQKCPLARQAIKYLVEDGRYDYIETGSLISIKQNTKDITIPSEEDRLEMYPMDFDEFQWALVNETLPLLLDKLWTEKKTTGILHREIMKQFRLYMLVGGMPQAISEYITTNNFQRVDIVKRRRLRLYEDDFMKIDSSGRLSKLYFSIPAQLNKNVRRYVTSSVIGKQTEDAMLQMIGALSDSRVVKFSYCCNDPSVGMSLNKNEELFKMYLSDTGLFITLAFCDKKYTDNTIYQKLLLDKLPVNLGYIFENMVAQILVSRGHKLFYYTWPKDERHYYEIDFLVSEGSKISPIEVKSSNVTRHSSLEAFYKKYSSRILHNYLVCPKEYSKDKEIIILPLYYLSYI